MASKRHIHKIFKLIAVLFLFTGAIRAMVFDNRYLPLYQKQYTKFEEYKSHLIVQPFASTADSAFNENGEIVPISFFDGSYDMVQLNRSLLKSGKISSSLFKSEWQNQTAIPWQRNGLLESQGVAFLYHQSLGYHMAFGASALFMHVGFHQQWQRELGALQTSLIAQPEGDENELLLLKEKINALIGVTPAQYSAFGFGDLDIYLRYGDRHNYIFKMRSIDWGFRLGVLVPSGMRSNILNPASVPFGANGFWGMYGALDAEFELRRNLKAGGLLRISKRFPNTVTGRMPVFVEPTSYGVLTGPLKVDPGFTFIMAPYIMLDGLRDGLGLKVAYTWVKHKEDHLFDLRADKTIESSLHAVRERSAWVMENVTLEFRYDFGRSKEDRGLLPIVSLAWDIPTSYFATPKNCPRTNFVSLLIESCF